MYIDVVPNRTSPPAILLRESYRDGNKVRKRTLLNLTSRPRHLVGLSCPAQPRQRHPCRAGGTDHRPLAATRLRRRGARHPAAHRSRSSARTRRQPLPAIALIVSRIIAPTSKLATGKALDP